MKRLLLVTIALLAGCSNTRTITIERVSNSTWLGDMVYVQCYENNAGIVAGRLGNGIAPSYEAAKQKCLEDLIEKEKPPVLNEIETVVVPKRAQ